jgi:hypothetical protein
MGALVGHHEQQGELEVLNYKEFLDQLSKQQILKTSLD